MYLYWMTLNVFKHLLVCSILALSNITNLPIQISIFKLTVWLHEKGGDVEKVGLAFSQTTHSIPQHYADVKGEKLQIPWDGSLLVR